MIDAKELDRYDLTADTNNDGSYTVKMTWHRAGDWVAFDEAKRSIDDLKEELEAAQEKIERLEAELGGREP